jgi:hypothetical protein
VQKIESCGERSASRCSDLSADLRSTSTLIEIGSGRQNPSAERRAIENVCRIFLSPRTCS